MHQILDRKSGPPPGRFKIRPRREFRHVPETEVRQHLHRPRNPQQPFQRGVVQNTDPPDADPFHPCRQPKVLNGTTGTVQIGIPHRRTSKNMRTASLPAAGHAEVDRGFLDAFQFEAPVQFRARLAISPGRCRVRLIEEVLHGTLRLSRTDNDKIPGLHEPHRTCMVGGTQQAREDLVGNRRR